MKSHFDPPAGGRPIPPSSFQSRILARAALGVAALAVAAIVSAGPIDPKLYAGLKWRNIGPFRGGRISAVTGVVGQSGVFYAGLPLGGVWKTTSAGVTWTPIFDSVKDASSVGAVEVAPSNPNVIYVGMGDLITGGGINEGNGVYKSIDAGKTWTHLGLDETKQIPSILVDPHNPDLVMVAAQGNVHKKSDQRGLYRSTDGGKTWTKTLYVDDETGIQKIAWAYDDPKVMLATTVRHYYAPGAFGRGFGGRGQGPSGTQLYKSTDEGLTWKEITSDTLPDLAGRTCVAVAMNTHAQRMFLVGNFGLYRSDNGGDTWARMDAKDRRVANGQGGYNCGVYVDSQNPDTVYVINTCCYRSTDGGETFTGFKGAPGGDDPQQLWIDPTNHTRLLLGSDQGATISLDGGLSWSSWYNQATAQVYHISVDNSFPYWVYATQQDSGAVATRSRGDLGAITPLDWRPTPGYEFGSIVADPLNPKIVYSGGPAGGIVKITYPNGQWINVSPNVDSGEALRKVGNQPILWSETNPHELMTGFQYLMATTDGGMHWKKLSPDLGYPKGVTPPKPGTRPAARPTRTPVVKPPVAGSAVKVKEDEDDDDFDPGDKDAGQDANDEDGQRQPGGGGAIESFSPSSVNGGIIWVGTNNGLIKLTKDHGRSWEDVTIPGLAEPTRADISSIEASHETAGEAYAAIDYHGTGDYKPYLYRTRDFGKTWHEIVTGLPTDQPSGSFARFIRSDTIRAGLLFAGTESSVYVSFDDGDNWQPLTENLPNTSYRDMVIKGNDLVVGTYGRGFWILDDIEPLREMTAATDADAVHLFKPADAIRLRRNTGQDTPFPPEIPHAENPPLGAIIDYSLGSKPTGEVTLDVTDSQGKEVRHMSSIPDATDPEAYPPIPNFWIEKPEPLPTNVGANRTNWDLRYDEPATFSHSYEINANPGETPPSPEGPLVEPGIYTITLKVDGKSYTQTVKVVNDPRSPASAGDLRAQHALQARLYGCADDAMAGYKAAQALGDSVKERVGTGAAADLATAAEAYEAKVTAVGGSNGFGRRFFGFGRGGGAPAAPTFAQVNGSLVRQLSSLDSGDMAPNEPTTKACMEACAQLKTVMKNWATLTGKELDEFNTVLVKHGLKPISAPAPLHSSD